METTKTDTCVMMETTYSIQASLKDTYNNVKSKIKSKNTSLFRQTRHNGNKSNTMCATLEQGQKKGY